MGDGHIKWVKTEVAGVGFYTPVWEDLVKPTDDGSSGHRSKTVGWIRATFNIGLFFLYVWRWHRTIRFLCWITGGDRDSSSNAGK